MPVHVKVINPIPHRSMRCACPRCLAATWQYGHASPGEGSAGTFTQVLSGYKILRNVGLCRVANGCHLGSNSLCLVSLVSQNEVDRCSMLLPANHENLHPSLLVQAHANSTYPLCKQQRSNSFGCQVLSRLSRLHRKLTPSHSAKGSARLPASAAVLGMTRAKPSQKTS